MKKTLAAAALGAAALLLAACGGSSGSAPASSAAAPASSAAPQNQGDIAFSYGNESAGIYPIVANPAKEEATSRGYNFLEGSANGDCKKQVQDLENFVTQQVKALVVLPLCGVDPVKSVLKQAKDAGIKVVGYSQAIPGVSDSAITYDNVKGAQDLADNALAWYKKELGGKPSDLHWVLYTYDQCGQPCTDRTDTIRKKIVDATGVKPYEAESVAEDTGQKALETLLQKDPKINMVIGINDAGALGAYQTFVPLVKDGSRDPSKIYIAGMDGQTEALQLIADGGGQGGIYRASGALILDQLGKAVADLPIDLLNGKSQAELKLPYEIVTTANSARAKEIVDNYKKYTG